MKSLTFRHSFSNGITVTLRVFRAPSGRCVMIADKKNFHHGIEQEYEAWCDEIAKTIWENSDDSERTVDFLEGLARSAGLPPDATP